ncbi:MAG: hypothetical protein ACO3LE_11515 [Bdellovibrionota bacterium]
MESDSSQKKAGLPTSSTLASNTSASDRLGLEDIVHLANKVGLEYAVAKKEADRMELLKPTIRARIMLRLDDGSMSETRLRRLTETDAEYVDFLEKMAEMRGEAEKLRVRYESYKNLFDAKRSLLSYQKAEMKLI